MKIEEEINQSKFSGPAEKAVVNLIYTANFVEDTFRKMLREKGISLPQYNVLRILRGRKDGYATCGDLKDVMLDKNPDVTRLCDKLVDKKFIQRSSNKQNRRQILLRISEKGLQLLDEMAPHFSELHTKINQMTEEELLMISDLMDKMRNSIRQ